MPPLRPLALLVSASLMAGCAVGPDYQRPDAPLSDRYLGQSAVELRPVATPASLVAWWEGFGDPVLADFVSKALEQNLDLAQASARVTQARAGLAAANAALLPSGNISGQAARSYQSIETPLGQVLNSTPGYDRYGSAYEVNLGAGWEVDVFGGLRRGHEAALAEYQASEAAPLPHDWPSPRKPPISTSASADCRRGWTLRIDKSKPSRGCWRKSACSTARASLPTIRFTRLRERYRRSKRQCRSCRPAWMLP